MIEKAIKAMGGEENLAKGKAFTFTMKGKLYGMGDGIDYTATIPHAPIDHAFIGRAAGVHAKRALGSRLYAASAGADTTLDVTLDLYLNDALFDPESLRRAR